MTSTTEPDLAYFQSIPWCEKLLTSPDVVITPTNPREYKASTLDAFCAETLKTEDTIRAWVSFYNKPSSDGARVEELHSLLSLGYRINGHPHIAHGGLLATVVDEVMGILLGVNRRLNTLPFKGDTVTAYLNTTYVKPVATPQTVLVSARFRDVVGRKHFTEATITNEAGTVLLRSEALFVGFDGGKLKEML